MSIINFHRLDIFKVIYETKSISDASKILKLTQPTVSRHLRYFEDTLKFKLFTTQKGRLHPTWEAHQLYRESKVAFDQLERVEQLVGELKYGGSDPLRVTSTPSILTNLIIPRVTSELKKQYPDQVFAFELGYSMQQLSAVRAGYVDIGFIAGRADLMDFKVDHLISDKFVAVVPKNHDLAAEKVFRLEFLEDYETIMPPEALPFGSYFFEELNRREIKPKVTITCRGVDTAMRFVEEMECCAIVNAVSAALLIGERQKIMPLEVDLTFSVQAIRPLQAAHREVSESFIARVKSQLQALDYAMP
ncbi:LysR family transcriptional regulator [Polycladidibacter stylochi]|uniref:LysR substrate-binding domain-containing protein n=1 Tax=Polycladidibacter stylochi TaxID=1807766 RepID=UPI000833D950|nr:LysR family transcriptional regulator [Pseudovibrio stylochi]